MPSGKGLFVAGLLLAGGVAAGQFRDRWTQRRAGGRPSLPPGVIGCLLPSAAFGTQTTFSNTPISPRIVQLGAKFIF